MSILSFLYLTYRAGEHLVLSAYYLSYLKGAGSILSFLYLTYLTYRVLVASCPFCILPTGCWCASCPFVILPAGRWCAPVPSVSSPSAPFASWSGGSSLGSGRWHRTCQQSRHHLLQSSPQNTTPVTKRPTNRCTSGVGWAGVGGGGGVEETKLDKESSRDQTERSHQWGVGTACCILLCIGNKPEHTMWGLRKLICLCTRLQHRGADLGRMKSEKYTYANNVKNSVLVRI